jgi:hypothetical protein
VDQSRGKLTVCFMAIDAAASEITTFKLGKGRAAGNLQRAKKILAI